MIFGRENIIGGGTADGFYPARSWDPRHGRMAASEYGSPGSIIC
jgi:hypothetical protein